MNKENERTYVVASPRHEVVEHALICAELNALYSRKNRDYGDSFHKVFLEEGMAMVRIRLSDKLERIKSITKSGSALVSDESLRDTVIDLANYAIMTVLEIDRIIGQQHTGNVFEQFAINLSGAAKESSPNEKAV